MNTKLIIFDTTLRDGEQSPGASMTQAEKLRIARALELMRVDVIEAGFPAASPGDAAAVAAVAEQIKESTVCALSRANPQDIDAAAEALKPAARKRIHTFIATSALHMEKKLRMTPDEVLASVESSVKRACNYADDVEFSAEDAGRSDPDFLCRVFECAIAAGAGTINVPDTVGYTVPEQFAGLVRQLFERVPNIDKAVVSVHCHDDLGLAVANSLAAVLVGARQVECTINGIGERAGNASLEEVVMAVRTRRDYFPCDSAIESTHLVPTSKLVSNITGFAVQPNKAVVGANAFAHEAGIHQAGVLRARETYEIMEAADVGWHRNHLVLGKHSGRAAFKARLKDLAFEFSTQGELDEAFARFKELADRKHEVFDEDLQALITQFHDDSEGDDTFQLLNVQISYELGKAPFSSVTLSVNGKVSTGNGGGNGIVAAVFAAIEKVVDSGVELEYYAVNAITGGSDAQGDVTTRLSRGAKIANGHGTDTDIVFASAKSYINALNHLYRTKGKAAAEGVQGNEI